MNLSTKRCANYCYLLETKFRHFSTKFDKMSHRRNDHSTECVNRRNCDAAKLSFDEIAFKAVTYSNFFASESDAELIKFLSD